MTKVPADKESQYTETAIKEKLNVSGLRRDPDLPESNDNAKLKRLILYLERSRTSGLLLARVDVRHPESVTIVDDTAAATVLNNGLQTKRHPPPEVLMPEPPTEQDTIDLFELDDKQGLSFRIITRTLIAEKNGENVAQLKMAIVGQAGTGKSEIMKAVIWFAFQHGISRYIGVSSFQWKAALLVR